MFKIFNLIGFIVSIYAQSMDDLATREDAIRAYQLILGRMPESEAVITANIGKPIKQLHETFTKSYEHQKKIESILTPSDTWSIKFVRDNYCVSKSDMTGLRKAIEMLPYIRIVPVKDQKAKNAKLFSNFLSAFFDKEKIYRIPHIHHRLWITSENEPQEPLKDSLDMYIQSLSIFPKDWQHIFWCIDPSKLPNTITAITKQPIQVEIRSIKELITSMPGKYLYDRLYEGKHYAIAGDLVKRYLVYKFGGFYNDIGIRWKKDPTEFVDTFDRIVNMTPIFQPDVALYAAAAQSPVEEVFYKILEAFPSLSDAIKQNFNGGNIMKLTWIHTLKALLDTELKENEKIFYWDQHETCYREWKHCGSWQKDDILGNSPITKSTTKW